MGCEGKARRRVGLEGVGVLAVSQELNAFTVSTLFTF